MKTKWTASRLQRLFDRYNRSYWRGKLAGYAVVRAELSEKSCIGRCDLREKRIEIDVDQHTSDGQLRATLLHEMAHAGAGKPGHSVEFFAQMERLIGLGAPVKVSSPEAGHAHILVDIVPKRFPMLRAKMERVEHRRSNAVLKMARATNSKIHTITDDEMVSRFEEMAQEMTWRKARIVVGLEYGLTDDTGRPLNAWARRVIRRAQKAFRSARRDHLKYEKTAREYEQLSATSEETRP